MTIVDYYYELLLIEEFVVRRIGIVRYKKGKGFFLGWSEIMSVLTRIKG